MRGTKLYGIVAAAFMAGAFLTSPELRAYAAATIGSDDIINESIRSEDIKNGQVKAADIAADAVGASEIQGVTKLLFGQCAADSTEGTSNIAPGNGILIRCSISGVDADDSTIAQVKSAGSCFEVRASSPFTNVVNVIVSNECTTTQQFGTGSQISIIVFDK